MDRPFETLFTPKTVLSYAKFLALLALQPVFQLWSWIVLALLGKGVLQKIFDSSSARSKDDSTTKEYSLVDFRDALFLRSAIDEPKNRPTVTIALTINSNKSKTQEDALGEIRRKLKTFIRSDLAAKNDLQNRLTSIPKCYLGLWFWEKPSSLDEEPFIEDLLTDRVRISAESDSSRISAGYQNEVTLENPWKVFVTPVTSENGDQEAYSVVFVAHRCLVDEKRAGLIIAAFDEECFTVLNLESKLDGKSEGDSKSDQPPIWEQIIDYGKMYHGAANYFASLDQCCREKNDFFDWQPTGKRLQGKGSAGIPSQVIQDLSTLNKVGKIDVLHVGICAAFQNFHERNGKNRGLDFVLSCLLNPSSYADSSKASNCGRFWFPTLNGPPETKMWMIKDILNHYGLNESCDFVSSTIINRIPEKLLKLDFSWTFGVAHVVLPSTFKMAEGNSLDFISFTPGGTGGFGFTCVHHPQTTTRVFIEGDEAVLKSAKEIEYMCEDVLAEAKMLRNFAAASHPGKQVAPMDYPASGVRLQPPPVGERSAIRLVQNGSANHE